MDRLIDKNKLKVVNVRIIGKVCRVIFSDDFEATICSEDVVGNSPGTFGRDLLDPNYFIQVTVDSKGRLVWPNEFSVHPVHLHEYLMSKIGAA